MHKQTTVAHVEPFAQNVGQTVFRGKTEFSSVKCLCGREGVRREEIDRGERTEDGEKKCE